MAESASLTVNQDGIKSFLYALFAAQSYDVFIDGRTVGVLDGYHATLTSQVSPGPHSVYVRAYARNSVSLTRVYGYSKELEVELAAGEHKVFSCGRMPGPPLRGPLIFIGLALTFFLWFGPGPIARLPVREHNLVVAGMALVTYACGWIGYSTKRGATIYLKEAQAAGIWN